MAEIVPAVATLASPFVQHLIQKYKAQKDSLSLAELHELLKDRSRALLALQSDNGNLVSRNSEQKEPTELYKHWDKEVSIINQKVDRLTEKYDGEEKEDGERRHLIGIRRHFSKERGRLKGEIKRALDEVMERLHNCPTKILADKLPVRVKEEINVPLVGEYPTLKKAFTDTLTKLLSVGVKCVALWGQKGTGKTTIMRSLNNYLYGSSYFDMVIFIKVPDDKQTDVPTEYLHILQKIAERIKVDNQSGEDEVARRIQRELKNKRYLLILDNVRYALALETIWGMLDISNHKKDGKVVIATNYILAWRANCVKGQVKLEMLTTEEAWNMFRVIVGDDLLQDIPNAQQICERFCSRLPLLIHSIATSFRYQEDPPDWQWALSRWTPWNQVGVDGFEELYSNLEICYQLLRQNQQKCFLYASLYPANAKICTDHFVECCIVQGFLDDVDKNTRYSEKRSRTISRTLKRLVNVAFLEEGEEGGRKRYVKMNDFYRQFALHISEDPNSECGIYVDREEYEQVVPTTRNHTWVSIVGSRRESLPTIQNCGSLQALLLHKNLTLAQIPANYFDNMSNLLVLNLYRTQITTLPSLRDLTGLKAFYLNGCSELKIRSHDEIQPLQHLEVFDIRGTRVNFVPNLGHLRCLKISYDPSVDYPTIQMPSNLEEFLIDVERQFRQQWSNVAQQIHQFADSRNITLIPNLK